MHLRIQMQHPWPTHLSKFLSPQKQPIRDYNSIANKNKNGYFNMNSSQRRSSCNTYEISVRPQRPCRSRAPMQQQDMPWME
eukprot:1939380-Amphidinium_carterae.1